LLEDSTHDANRTLLKNKQGTISHHHRKGKPLQEISCSATFEPLRFDGFGIVI